MRLLRTDTLDFEEFEGRNIPPYAILSHRWGKNEVLYRDLERDTSSSKREGYDKLRNCAEIARRHGHQYFWVDTCCIDKSSSAELTEAINSMYRWYKNAQMCYAHLSDVPSNTGADSKEVVLDQAMIDLFRKSKWFTRGWTLQELLAPPKLRFFSQDWKAIGTKEELAVQISSITGINIRAIQGESLQMFTVAERMSWSARRETTREEDIAYCLLGIFDVNMPLLYGEGEKAFLRLQEEIIKSTADASLFAWKNPVAGPPTGLLAPSPSCYVDSGMYSGQVFETVNHTISTLAGGIRVRLFRQLINGQQTLLYRACLPCGIGSSTTMRPAIHLKRLNFVLPEDNVYECQRVDSHLLEPVNVQAITDGAYADFFVRSRSDGGVLTLQRLGDPGTRLFYIATRNPSRCFPSDCWDVQSLLLRHVQSRGKPSAVYLTHPTSLLLLLGTSDSGEPWCRMLACTADDCENVWDSYVPTGRETVTDTLVIPNHIRNKLAVAYVNEQWQNTWTVPGYYVSLTEAY